MKRLLLFIMAVCAMQLTISAQEQLAIGQETSLSLLTSKEFNETTVIIDSKTNNETSFSSSAISEAQQVERDLVDDIAVNTEPTDVNNKRDKLVKLYGRVSFNLEYQNIEVDDIKGQVGLDISWMRHLFVGFSLGFGKSKEEIRKNTTGDVRIGYRYKYPLLNDRLFFEGRTILGYRFHSMYKAHEGFYKERDSWKNKYGDDWEKKYIDDRNNDNSYHYSDFLNDNFGHIYPTHYFYIGFSPRIGYNIIHKERGFNLAITAGYRWDIANLQCRSGNTIDFFTAGLMISF